MEEIRPNVPVLPQEQVWSRNQNYKNWGTYKPYSFKEGQPEFIVPSSFLLICFVVAQLIFAIVLVSDLKSETFKFWFVMLRFLSLGLSLWAFWLLIRCDPGIESKSDPIINLSELSRYQNFCLQCKCLQTGLIKHCPYCRVCIQNSIVHLSISKMCITQNNLLNFVGLCLTVILEAFLML